MLDADDVVATMQRILDPATGSRARANIAMVEKVEAVDPLTVRFTLNIPYAGFPDIFGERQLRIVAKDEIAEHLDEADRHRAVPCSSRGRPATGWSSRRTPTTSRRACRSSTA